MSVDTMLENDYQFTVTRRTHRDILDYVAMKEDDIKELPHHATIIEVGSGINQEFAAWVRSVRPDIHMISVDPTMGLDPKREDIYLTESADSINYFKRRGSTPLAPGQVLYYQEIQRDRQQKSADNGLVVTKPVNTLNIRKESVDLLIDSHGPVMYLNKKDFSLYLDKLSAWLKPGMEARLYPLGHWALLRGQMKKEEVLANTRSTLEGLLTNTKLILKDMYIQEQGIGVILSKV